MSTERYCVLFEDFMHVKFCRWSLYEVVGGQDSLPAAYAKASDRPTS